MDVASFMAGCLAGSLAYLVIDVACFVWREYRKTTRPGA